ncbi:oligosaccharide flippase family protein [Polynucleobacter sp. JS-Mosq-20-D10]|nr:oligosaccharide flippase family protein [Polynucleobacter sp. JS-Mosq-20-D10]
MDSIKRFSKEALIYGIGGILNKGLSFLMIPIYTRIFSVGEYGAIEILNLNAAFVSIIISLGMDATLSMYFYKFDESDRGERKCFVSSILQLRLIWGFFVAILSTLLVPIIFGLISNGDLNFEIYGILFLGVLINQIVSIASDIMRLTHKPGKFLLVSLMSSIVCAALTIFFCLAMNYGVFGYFLALAMSGTLIAIYSIHLIKNYLSFSRIYSEYWVKIIKFGVPFMPAAITMYLMNSTDRWFLEIYKGVESVGIYAIGLKFAYILSLLVEGVRQAWWPVAMELVQKDDNKKIFRNAAEIYLGSAAIGVILLTYCSPKLIDILVSEQYRESWRIVGLLAWQPVLYGFFSIICIGIWKSEKSYINAIIMGMSALVCVMCNWLLVKSYGYVGSAISTIIAYLFWITVSLYISESLWRVGYKLKIMLMQITLALGYTSWFVFVELGNMNIVNAIVGLIIILIILSMIIVDKEKININGFKKYIF